MLCDHLEGWEGDARGRGYGGICIHIADSLCYAAETNNIIKQLYSNKDVKKKKSKVTFGQNFRRLLSSLPGTAMFCFHVLSWQREGMIE